MSGLWKDTDTKQLILNYNGILWGLREEIHCRVRNFDGQDYVIPEILPTEFFEHKIKPGMLDAKETIEQLLEKRGLADIPILEFEIMISGAYHIKLFGWESYKQLKKAGLDARR